MPMLETLTWIHVILASGAKVFRHHECPLVGYERTGSPNPGIGINKHTTNSWKTVPVSQFSGITRLPASLRRNLQRTTRRTRDVLILDRSVSLRNKTERFQHFSSKQL
jgi:hypothetical protein